MSIEDLLSLAKTNRNLIGFIVDDYIEHHKFAKKEVIFIDPPKSYFGKSVSDWKESDNHIEVGNVQTISDFLQRFGHLVSNLRIKFYSSLVYRKDYYSENEVHEIFRLINLHCSETLSTFTILTKVDTKNTFQSFTRPFQNVRKLSLEGQYHNVSNFNEIFPSVRDLSLLSIYYNHLGLLDQAIPNLEHLTISHDQGWMMRDTKAFMRLNSHMRSLFIFLFSPLYLSFVAEELPNLEEFVMSDLDTRREYLSDELANQVVNLENIKMFRSITFNYFPWNMQFRDLEEFHVSTMTKKDTNRFVDLVIRYKATLKKVYLGMQLTNTDIERLAEADMRVEELTFECENDAKTEHFVKIIENNEELVKFVIRYFWADVERGLAVNELKNRFGNNWFIVDSDHSIILERRY